MANKDLIDLINKSVKTDNVFTMSPSLYDDLYFDVIDRSIWKKYEFMGSPVPRVNDILDQTIGEKQLNRWIASCGDDYFAIRQRALDTGSMAHLMIGEYITSGSIRDKLEYLTLFPAGNFEEANNCRINFVAWEEAMKNSGYIVEYLYLEKEITCPWYGGTIDLIASITDLKGMKANYIIDFKTSKQITVNYILQTMLYMLAVNYHNTYISTDLPMIDGIGVLRLDKTKLTHSFFAANNFEDTEYMKGIQNAAISMVNWYWQFYYVTATTKEIRRNKRGLKHVK